MKITTLMLAALLALPAYAEPRTPAERLDHLGFPAIAQAWNKADHENDDATGVRTEIAAANAGAVSARHSLIFTGLTALGLASDERWREAWTTFTPASIAVARARRAQLQAANPDLVVLAELREHDARGDALPADSPWWRRDAAGNRVPKPSGTVTDDYFLLDVANHEFQERLGAQCKAVIATGAADGCFFDWWHETPDLVALAKAVRTAIGADGLILVNVNVTRPVDSAPYINGIYMEGFGAPFFADFSAAMANMRWADANLRRPAFYVLDAWFPVAEADNAPGRGRNNYRLMRQATTMALVAGNGFALFADPNPLPVGDHLHDWYSFWTAPLGRPTAPGQTAPDGSLRRSYEHGLAVVNPPGNPDVTVVCVTPCRSQGSGETAASFELTGGDGGIFLDVR